MGLGESKFDWKDHDHVLFFGKVVQTVQPIFDSGPKLIMTKIVKGAFLECPDPKHVIKVQKSGKTTFFVHPIQRFLKLA